MFAFFKRQLHQKGYEIRTIHGSEIKDLAALARDTFIETYPDYIEKKGGLANVDEDIKSLYSADTLSDWISSPNYLCLGLFQLRPTANLLGFSLLELKEDRAFLSKIYLLKSQQGQGLGRVLMEANFSALRKRQAIRELKLDVWTENIKAKAFYEKIGFHPNGVKKLYPGSSPDCPMYDEEYVKTKNTLS